MLAKHLDGTAFSKQDFEQIEKSEQIVEGLLNDAVLKKYRPQGRARLLGEFGPLLVDRFLDVGRRGVDPRHDEIFQRGIDSGTDAASGSNQRLPGVAVAQI